MAKFVITNGAEAGSAYDFSAPEMVIGRQTGVEIKLNGTNVSRRHARIFRDGPELFVEDLNSSNGTYLNGSKLANRVPLKPRDEIRIGPYVLRFENEAADPDVTIRARTVANTANLELYKENAARKLQIILQLSTDLSRTLDLEILLPEILNHLFALFPNAERGLMIMFEGDKPVVRACRQRNGAETAPRFSKSILQSVLADKVAIFAEDVQSDARFAEAQSICSLGVRSLICVPLQTKGGKIFGVLQLERMGAGNRFSPEDLNFLTTIGLQVSVALENAQLHQELLHKHRIEREIAVARDIQLGYLPKALPRFADLSSFELHAELSPAYEISGDFYDYFKIGEDRLALAVADVSGKGVPAALFMSMVRALLRNLAVPGKSAGQILAELNNALAIENPNCQFVTVALALFDPASGELELSSGGHPPALLRERDGGVRLLNTKGPLLGFDLVPAPLPNVRVTLQPGDAMLLYTDGITEAPAASMEMFGLARLEETVRGWSDRLELQKCAEAIRAAVTDFTRNTSQEDDITLALLRRI